MEAFKGAASLLDLRKPWFMWGAQARALFINVRMLRHFVTITTSPVRCYVTCYYVTFNCYVTCDQIISVVEQAELRGEVVPGKKGQAVGLSSIAAAVLGKPLDKGMQTSNWAQRPLLDSQIAYAAQVLKYLSVMYICNVIFVSWVWTYIMIY